MPSQSNHSRFSPDIADIGHCTTPAKIADNRMPARTPAQSAVRPDSAHHRWPERDKVAVPQPGESAVGGNKVRLFYRARRQVFSSGQSLSAQDSPAEPAPTSAFLPSPPNTSPQYPQEACSLQGFSRISSLSLTRVCPAPYNNLQPVRALHL